MNPMKTKLERKTMIISSYAVVGLCFIYTVVALVLNPSYKMAACVLVLFCQLVNLGILFSQPTTWIIRIFLTENRLLSIALLMAVIIK